MSYCTTAASAEWMVVCDLDGTLLGRTDATKRFRDWWNSRVFSRRLVYASGRRYDSVADSIEQFELPKPDAVVADVGSDVRIFPSGIPLLEWSSRWWSTWEIDGVRAALDGQPELEPQPTDCQTPFKRSYFVRNPHPDWLSRTKFRLRESRLRAELIYSSNRDLDVLPAGVNKGSAAEFLAQKWKVPPTRVLVAGDSGNDLSMFVHGFRGIVVENAQTELRDIVGPNVYRSANGYADGVIEGLMYWFSRREPGSTCFSSRKVKLDEQPK